MTTSADAGILEALREAIARSPIVVDEPEVAAPRTFAEWCARQPDIDAAVLAWIASHRRDYRRTSPVLM